MSKNCEGAICRWIRDRRPRLRLSKPRQPRQP